MGNGLEHLAAWRGRSTLTIWEAASLITGLDPDYPWPHTSKMDKDDKALFAPIKSWRNRLWKAAQGQGEVPQLVATIKNRPIPHTVGGSPFVTNFMNYEPPRTAATPHPDPTLSTVRVEDLCTWLEAIGQRPAFFFPESTDKGSTEPPPERGHANESDELRWAILASSRWWKPVDRDDKTTHPKKTEVAKWLTETFGADGTAADRIATLVRPDWAAKGRPSDK